MFNDNVTIQEAAELLIGKTGCKTLVEGINFCFDDYEKLKAIAESRKCCGNCDCFEQVDDVEFCDSPDVPPEDEIYAYASKPGCDQWTREIEEES